MASEMAALHRRGPDWLCRDCGEEWPCLTFRRRLWSLYRRDRHKLIFFMTHFLARARAELPGMPDDEMWERFLGWCRAGPAPRAKVDHES